MKRREKKDDGNKSDSLAELIVAHNILVFFLVFHFLLWGGVELIFDCIVYNRSVDPWRVVKLT